jgi:hypothetical protein
VTFLGIVVPALVLGALLRRDVPWKITLLFIALTLIFLHGAVFSSRLPVPVDEVARGYPWRGLFGDVVARNPSTNDTVKLFLPWMQVAREQLFHFRAPLWNPYSFSGYPLLGNGESAPFSPLFLATLFVPLPKQIVAMAGLKIFVALLFTYLLMKRERASDAAAIFAAIAFAWSTEMTVFLYYSTASVIAFLPAAAYALLRVIDEPRKRNIVLLAIVIGTLQANGHPESVLHVAIGCGALLAIDLTFASDRRAWLRGFVYALAGVVFGLVLSAPAWVPVLEQVRLSARFAEGGMKAFAFPRAAAWGIVSPNAFGNPVRHDYSWWINYASFSISYVGLLPLALCILVLSGAPAPRPAGDADAAGARQRPWRDRLLVIAAVLFYLTAMDWSVIGRLLNATPPLSIVANDKLRFVCVFFVAIAAAKALDRAKWQVAIAALPLVALALLIYREPADLAGVVAIILFLLLPARWAAVAIALELFALNAGFNALVKAKYFRPPLPIVQALRAHAPAEPFRVVGRDWVLLPNASAQYGLEDIRGSDPMAYAAYDAFLRRFTVQQEGTWVRRVVDVERPELDFLNVRFLVAEPDASVGGKWRLLYRGLDGTLFENTRVQPRFSGVEEMRQVRAGELTMRIRTPVPAEVRSSEPFDRGWRVDVGGRAVRPYVVDGAFLGFRVPAGEWSIRLRYQPLSYYGSIVAALAALVGLLWWKRTSHESDGTSRESDAKSHESDAKSRGSDAKSHGPDAKSHGPDAISHGSDAKSRGSDARSHGSDARSHGSDAKSNGPDAKSHGPDAKSHGPDAKSHEPDEPSHECHETSTSPIAGPAIPGIRSGSESLSGVPVREGGLSESKVI